MQNLGAARSVETPSPAGNVIIQFESSDGRIIGVTASRSDPSGLAWYGRCGPLRRSGAGRAS
jgi:hypothetical protein